VKSTFILPLAVMLFFVSTASGDCIPQNGFKITVLYDNYIITEGTTADWGFACLIEGEGQRVLFDTGAKSDVLLGNAEKLNLDLGHLDMIVLSHDHWDHTGGLTAVLKLNPNTQVYVPQSFPAAFDERTAAFEAVVTRVNEPLKIEKQIFLTGEIEGPVNELALVLKTDAGLALITGCSHPGIVKIAEHVENAYEENVHFVMGGFHLMQHSKKRVQDIANKLKVLGVIKCGATHCTGDKSIAVFKEEFGEDYVPIGVGKVIRTGLIE